MPQSTEADILFQPIPLDGTPDPTDRLVGRCIDVLHGSDQDQRLPGLLKLIIGPFLNPGISLIQQRQKDGSDKVAMLTPLGDSGISLAAVVENIRLDQVGSGQLGEKAYLLRRGFEPIAITINGDNMTFSVGRETPIFDGAALQVGAPAKIDWAQITIGSALSRSPEVGLESRTGPFFLTKKLCLQDVFRRRQKDGSDTLIVIIGSSSSVPERAEPEEQFIASCEAMAMPSRESPIIKINQPVVGQRDAAKATISAFQWLPQDNRASFNLAFNLTGNGKTPRISRGVSLQLDDGIQRFPKLLRELAALTKACLTGRSNSGLTANLMSRTANALWSCMGRDMSVKCSVLA